MAKSARKAAAIPGADKIARSDYRDERDANWWESQDPCPAWCAGHNDQLKDGPEPVEDRKHVTVGDEVTLSLETLWTKPRDGRPVYYFSDIAVSLEQHHRERAPRVVICTQLSGDPQKGRDTFSAQDHDLTLEEAERLHRLLGEQIAMARRAG